MKTPRRLARLAATALPLLACSSSGGSHETTTTHDAGADAHVTHPADAAPADRSAPVDVFVPDRAPGQRTPLSAECDPVDGTRCLLPWPSNTFTVVDSTTATGLRLAVAKKGVGPGDDPASLNRTDGFSRVSTILTGFDGTIDKASLGDLTTGAVRLIVEQPGATFGQEVPLRFDVVTDTNVTPPQSLLVASPRVPLAPATDYAVVVTDSVKLTGGAALTADREAEVALGVASPRTPAEGALYAYDAPARAAMKSAGLDPHHAIRVWDFTTRSLLEPTLDVNAMRAAELAAFEATPAGDAGVSPDGGGGVGIALDSVSTTTTGTVAVAVTGHLTGVPSFRTAAGSLNRDATGAPAIAGVHDVPFRVAIPAGTGDYHIVMYGHGTGGTYDEDNFDQEITANGAVKVGTQFMGWTASSVVDTFALFNEIVAGSEISSAGLMQSLADTMVVQRALGSSLGAVLAAPTLMGTTNPAAGRRPSANLPVWVGGSLGGILGFVYSSAEPTIPAGVLNVPGAAWAQFVPYSLMFTSYVSLVMRSNYPSPIDVRLAVATAQNNFDPIDGAAWYDAVGDHHPVFLEQESIGDPVVPNLGNEMVAAASHAVQVGVVVSPITTCTDVPQATNQTGMTQFRVPPSVTAPYSIHGFAAGSSVAGVAAQQQIEAFIASVWAGSPVITIPPACVTNTPANSCDFSGN